MSLTILNTDDIQQCTMCTSPTSDFCPVCKTTSYCSKTCKMADFPVHKLLCRDPPAREVSLSYEGQFPTFQAVLFPAGETSPRWVKFKGNHPPGIHCTDHWGNQKPDPAHPTVQLLSDCKTPLTITGNALRSRSRTPNTLELYSTAGGPGPGRIVNLSALTVTHQRPAQLWFGSLLALKLGPSSTVDCYGRTLSAEQKRPQYLDMDMVDYRDVVDFLCTYPAIDINVMSNASAAAACFPKREVTGVRINCPGDCALGRPRFEPVSIRADDAECRAAISPISQLIQLPMRVSRCRPPHDAGFDRATNEMVNLAATDLMMGVDPAGEWGWSGLEWVDPAGSVVVVRDGGQELHPQVVEALCYWCMYVLRPLVRDSMGYGRNPEDPIAKETVLARIGKREWECFYTGFDELKGSGPEPWVKGVWPV